MEDGQVLLSRECVTGSREGQGSLIGRQGTPRKEKIS
jgi:hypothetical protein